MIFRNYFFEEENKEGGGAAGQAAGQANGTDAGTNNGEGVKPAWPENWREDITGGDEKELKQAQRYASPKDIWRKARALEQRLSSGELRSALPADATEEQVKTWRAENGIPEAPEKYELKLKDGLVIGEDDKPIIDGFLKSAHAVNLSPAQASAAVEWYYQELAAQQEARATEDAALKQAGEDALRAEWGNDYRRNVNMIGGLLDTAPQGVKDRLLGGRTADGNIIASDPDTLRFLASLALQINPVTTLVPNGGGNIAGAIDDEIAKIEKVMKEDRKAYNADEKMQERYRELLDARDKHGKAA